MTSARLGLVGSSHRGGVVSPHRSLGACRGAIAQRQQSLAFAASGFSAERRRPGKVLVTLAAPRLRHLGKSELLE